MFFLFIAFGGIELFVASYTVDWTGYCTLLSDFCLNKKCKKVPLKYCSLLKTAFPVAMIFKTNFSNFLTTATSGVEPEPYLLP
jgi:hypothetical protein